MISDVVNTMGSWATAEVTNILAGPAGDFIFFGLWVLILVIGIGIFRKFSGNAKW